MLLLLSVLLLLALAGCGGDDGGNDAEEIRQVVRDFVEATNERDGDVLCGELLTQEYKEGATGAAGDQADEACREQLRLTRDLMLELVSVGRVEVDGERATVRAVIDMGGVRAPRLFRLEREDGAWKLDAGSEP
ncbi:MAG: hypothetical protein ACRDL4_14440 [Thermoleophilaceae bacterium]